MNNLHNNKKIEQVQPQYKKKSAIAHICQE